MHTEESLGRPKHKKLKLSSSEVKEDSPDRVSKGGRPKLDPVKYVYNLVSLATKHVSEF